MLFSKVCNLEVCSRDVCDAYTQTNQVFAFFLNVFLVQFFFGEPKCLIGCFVVIASWIMLFQITYYKLIVFFFFFSFDHQTLFLIFVYPFSYSTSLRANNTD